MSDNGNGELVVVGNREVTDVVTKSGAELQMAGDVQCRRCGNSTRLNQASGLCKSCEINAALIRLGNELNKPGDGINTCDQCGAGLDEVDECSAGCTVRDKLDVACELRDQLHRWMPAHSLTSNQLLELCHALIVDDHAGHLFGELLSLESASILAWGGTSWKSMD